MTEANNNANSSNEFNFEAREMTNERENREEKASATGNEFNLKQNNLQLDRGRAQPESGEQKMNWQKVAHKLREYNRKLLKKVFRLEQELADIDNKFTKYIEKSRSNDVLVAQQEEKIRKYQEQTESFDLVIAERQAIIEQKEIAIANLSQQQDLFQQQIAKLEQEIGESQGQIKSFDLVLEERQSIIDKQEIAISDLSEQRDLSQQQTAQLERDCALLQENYNHQVYQLTTKDKEIKELQNKLSQQQRATIQYKAELKRYEEQTKPAASTKEPKIPQRQSYSQHRTIKPWSTSVIPEKNIILPKAKSQSIAAKKTTSSETIKTAAQIATWSASQAQEKQNSTYKTTAKTTAKSESSVKVKPKSLAAVDLPTFPRP